MTMEKLLQAAMHRRVVILSVVLITLVLVGFRTALVELPYEAKVKLQFSVPQDEGVVLFDRTRPGTSRDEMLVVVNNFTEVLNSRQVRDRTIEALQLSGSNAAFDIEIVPVRDSDFVYVLAHARSAELAEQIANAYATEALAYFGEVRAMPATAAKTSLATEVQASEQELLGLEKEFADFRISNNIGELQEDLAVQQELIKQVKLERDRRAADRQARRSVDELNRTITEYEAELQRLVGLESAYNSYKVRTDMVRDRYELLLKTYSEAQIKEHTVKQVSYIQIIEPAVAPQGATSGSLAINLLLALIGSLGVGLGLALLLDFISRNKVAVPTLRSSAKPTE
jgi:uncharacterized protein involved in exopolysaccharide biosynthesis